MIVNRMDMQVGEEDHKRSTGSVPSYTGALEGGEGD
jgi:hypothetical protein